MFPADASEDAMKVVDTPEGTQTPRTQLGSASETEVENENENVVPEIEKSASQKQLSLTFRDLTIRVTAPDEALGETLLSRVDPRPMMNLFGSKEHHKRVSYSRITGREF